MAISDSQFRLGVAIGAAVLVAGVARVRFCGSVRLPDKPATTGTVSGTSTELLASSAATAGVYQELLGRDAAAAGIRAPSLDDMARKFAYRSDEARHVLEVGQPAIEVAGLTVRALHAGDNLVLEIANATPKVPLAYEITTEVIPAASCLAAHPLPLDVNVIAAETLTRVECGWHDKAVVVVKKVETMEVPPLSAYLLDQTPPVLLGIEPRIARGAKHPGNKECPTMLSQTVRNELERGEIGWRDLADFYARHRCQTYLFPSDYRAFTTDKQRELPATRAGN